MPVYVLLLGMCSLLLFPIAALSAEYPKEPVTIKVEGAKMPPVTFPHATHVDKVKVACATCHHKDAQDPKACTMCHGASEAKGGAPLAAIPRG